MGQARLRGTQEQRQEAALEAQRERQAERDRKEMERNLELSRQWAALSPDERKKRINAAIKDAENYGYLAGVLGHDVASAIMAIDSKKRG